MRLVILITLIIESLIINFINGSNYDIQNNDIFVVSCILLNSIIMLFTILCQKKKKGGIKYFNSLLCLSYIIRVIFVFWDRYCRNIFMFPNSGRDTGSFDIWARDFIANGMAGHGGYSAVLGWIYKLFYPNPLWGQYFNVIASILTIVVVYRILCKLDIEQKYKTYAVLIMCFMPNYLIMSAILLRESFIALLLAIAIYYLLEWWYSNCWKNIIISIVSVLAATYLHSGTIAYVVAILIIVALGGNSARKFKFKLSTVLLVSVGVAFLLFIYNYYGDIFFNYMGGLNSIEDIANKSEVYATGGSAYSVYIVDDNSTLGFIINSPLRVFYFLASPLPWDWRGINDIIAFVGSGLFYMISVYYGFKAVSIKTVKNRNIIIIMMIIAISNSIIYSWGVSNAGTALRHRDKFIANFTLLLVLSFDAIYKFKKVGKDIKNA